MSAKHPSRVEAIFVAQRFGSSGFKRIPIRERQRLLRTHPIESDVEHRKLLALDDDRRPPRRIGRTARNTKRVRFICARADRLRSLDTNSARITLRQRKRAKTFGSDRVHHSHGCNANNLQVRPHCWHKIKQRCDLARLSFVELIGPRFASICGLLDRAARPRPPQTDPRCGVCGEPC